MVEHTVQNHPHSQAVGLLTQVLQVLLGAQHRVNPGIVGSIVAVVGGRLKNRV